MPQPNAKPRPEPAKDARAGSAAIEFALGIPVLVVLLTGLVEVGFVALQSMRVHYAAEAGMLYAAKNGFDAAGIEAAVAGSSATSGIAATPAPAQFCGCPSAAGVIEQSCNAPCSDGTAPGQYVRINARLAHQTILPYPGLPVPSTLTAQSIVRLN